MANASLRVPSTCYMVAVGALVALGGTVRAQVISVTDIGAASPGFAVFGGELQESLGLEVAAAGDVNGDGLGDMIVSIAAPFFPVERSRGRSYVVFGKTGTDVVEASALGTQGFAIHGINLYDGLGNVVSGAGDVNGDGLADVIVGGYLADPFGLNSAGQAFVVFGKTTLGDVYLSAIGTGGFAINGSLTGESVGYKVSGAGDVNGDGLADVVVGARGADLWSLFDVGRAYVVFGRTATADVNLSGIGSEGFVINGMDLNDSVGTDVAGAGDVNGDGLADLIVGGLGNPPAAPPDRGECYVVFGKASNTAVDLSGLGSGGFLIEGVSTDDLAGLAVCGAGDVNGDGLGDVVVAASASDPGGANNAGAV